MISGTHVRALVVGAALALAASGCEGAAPPTNGSPTPTAQATSSPAARTSPVASPSPIVPATPGVTPPRTPTSTAAPAPTVPAGRIEQLAPIEGFEVRSTDGGTAVARITSGLPSGCAVYSRAVASRTGTVVKVDVYNHLPTGNVACTAIYGMVTNEVPLGGGFTAGVVYTIDVNGTRQAFTPR